MNFDDLFSTHHYILDYSRKTVMSSIPKPSTQIDLSINENFMKICPVLFVFIALKQTDRRGGRLYFITCIDAGIRRHCN